MLSENLNDFVLHSYGSPPKYNEIKAGLPEDFADITKLEDLLSINYKLVGVKDQLRRNLISLIQSGEEKYPGIIGFDEDVLPALDRAILSKHDVFLVGQIGQAKTKLVKTIAENLLSPIPIIKGSITNDCPMDLPSPELISLINDGEISTHNPTFHISPESAEKIRNNGLETQIEWVDGPSRYKYVLATPDISVKDLVGYIDAIKVAKKGIEMYKIESYSPGQLMQAKHGLFCIDELPVLDPRKQVALLSVLQEGIFTTGSYPVIFKPKTSFFATANPIDYTHSGKVIEPLYDRLKSHIHTHYPKSIDDEMLIIIQEAKVAKSLVLSYLLKTLARLVQKTRNNPQINQERGVSVRLGIHGLELLVGEAERARTLSHKILASPRLTDMHCLSQVAKFELAVMDDTTQNRKKLFDDLIKESIKETCLEFFEGIQISLLDSIKQEFANKTFQVSQRSVWTNGSLSYNNQINKFQTLNRLVEANLEKIRAQQTELQNRLEKMKINSEHVTLIGDQKDEIKATLTEIILEGLCWVTPKILDKKEVGYVAATN